MKMRQLEMGSWGWEAAGGAPPPPKGELRGLIKLCGRMEPADAGSVVRMARAVQRGKPRASVTGLGNGQV